MGDRGLTLDSPESESKEKTSHTEIFDAHLPYYLSIGMSYADYWDGDNELPSVYRKAHDLERKRFNQNAWLQGKYYHIAIESALSGLFSKSSKFPYIEQPFPLSEKEAEERREQEYVDNAIAWRERMKLEIASRKHGRS